MKVRAGGGGAGELDPPSLATTRTLPTTEVPSASAINHTQSRHAQEREWQNKKAPRSDQGREGRQAPPSPFSGRGRGESTDTLHLHLV